MNQLNHFIFSLSMTLIFLQPSFINVALTVLFSFVFSFLIDLDHKLNEKAPWYRRRTWIQEPFGFVLIGLLPALLLSLIDKVFLVLILIPYASHLFLDYLCIFEAYPLAPVSRVKKKEGLGIFIPDSDRWRERAKTKKVKGISEDYFTLFSLILLILVVLLKFNIFDAYQRYNDTHLLGDLFISFL